MSALPQNQIGPEWNAKVPCLCCNKIVIVRYQDWGPTVAIVCLECLNNVSLPLLRSIFTLRSQNNYLNDALNRLSERVNVLEQEEITPPHPG